MNSRRNRFTFESSAYRRGGHGRRWTEGGARRATVLRRHAKLKYPCRCRVCRFLIPPFGPPGNPPPAPIRGFLTGPTLSLEPKASGISYLISKSTLLNEYFIPLVPRSSLPLVSLSFHFFSVRSSVFRRRTLAQALRNAA